MTYIFGVRSVNSSGASGWENSGSVQATQPPPAVSSVSAGRYEGDVVVNWDRRG